ncbi:MAG: Gfo/Idh/MocA family oxidoreductase [Planctomycetes bacterium]|nr:Gfo/Idh/MocA family oxidoreductase [Planctomycetota bacterium]MCH8118854.1 Gfo/Idh/MocA family oxidoreductase [Planctomycetota bacterium]
MRKKRDINRRQFLKSATGVTAGAIVFPYVVSSSALGKAGSVAASNRIVMGAIGVGSMGTGDMRDFMRKNEVQMVAVCDVDKSHRDKAKKLVDEKYGNSDCGTYLDFRELIGRGDLDAVMLALPDQWHSIPAVAAARAGLDIHAQKPLARTIREGRAICDAVQHYGRVWQTGSQQRSERNFHRACELVRNGRIGKVHRVEVGLPTGGTSDNKPIQPVPEGLDWDLWLGPAPWVPFRGVCHWNWRWIMDYSGGQLTDWAGHHIDIAHWGLGLGRTGPVEIEGRGVYPKDGIYNVPYEYKFTCKYANGLTMVVANNKQLAQGAKWYGESGKWIYVKRGKLEANPPSVLKEVIGPDETKLYRSRNHRQNFLDCIKSRKETIAPAEIGHRSISVALLGEIAMLTERKLRWDPEKEVFLNDDEANRMLSRPMRSPWHL